jgi:hypothetical protein
VLNTQKFLFRVWATMTFLMFLSLRCKGLQKMKVSTFPVCSIRFYRIFLDLNALSALTVSDAPIDVFSTPPQLDGELITLTLLPRSRWQTLLNLEVIQAWGFLLFFFELCN